MAGVVGVMAVAEERAHDAASTAALLKHDCSARHDWAGDAVHGGQGRESGGHELAMMTGADWHHHLPRHHHYL